jgi:outer membrane immunogenic protein
MKKIVISAVLALGVAQPAFAQDGESAADAKAGFRIEARAVLETPTVSNLDNGDDVYKLGSAMAFGGEVGFDFAVSDKVVLGPYATYEFSTVENCDGADCVSASDNYAIGLHGGVTVGSKGLFYAKVGYASLGLDADLPTFAIEASERGGGVQGAIGYEHGFGQNFYGRVELGYADNGDIFGISFQRRHAGVALGARF